MNNGIVYCLRAEIKSASLKNRELARARRDHFIKVKLANADGYSSAFSLIMYRKEVSRFETRAMNLAYAYHRGVPYKCVEKKSAQLTQYQHKKLVDLVARYASTSTLRIEEWLKGENLGQQ